MSEIRVSVIRRSDRANLMLRYTDPVTRRQVTKSAGTRRERDALREAAKWQAELSAGVATPGRSVGWDAMVQEYAETMLPSLRPNTRRSYIGTLSMFADNCDPRNAASITAEAVSRFTRELRRGGATEATIAKHLRQLKAFVRWAKDEGYVARVPRFRMPRHGSVAKPKGRPLAPGEVADMIDAASVVAGEEAAESWRLLIRGLDATGLRLGEALTLRWDRTEGGAWLTMNGRQSVMTFSPDAQKSGRSDVVPLAPEAVRLFEPLAGAEGWVFNPVGKRGRPFRDELRVGKRIQAIGREAGVTVNASTKKAASAQDLRRTFGLRWAQRVMPPVLKMLMRHDSIVTTMTYYAVIEAEEAAQAVWRHEVTNQ